MSDKAPLSIGASIAIAALVVLGCIGGWLIVLSGGFYHAPRRRPRDGTFVDGLPALLMASIVLVMAALAAVALVRTRTKSLVAQWLAAAAVLLPPVAYVVFQ